MTGKYVLGNPAPDQYHTVGSVPAHKSAVCHINKVSSPMGRNHSWPASIQSLFRSGNVRRSCEGAFVCGFSSGRGLVVSARNVCPNDSTVDVFRGVAWRRLVSAEGGGVCAGVYPGEALSGSTLISVVVVQNFSEIGQSAVKLQRCN